jgi:tight adherence protein B
MVAGGPLLFGLLVALAVLLGFVALWRILRSRDPTEERLIEYGAGDAAPVGGEAQPAIARRRLPTVTRLLAGFGLGPRLALALARADLPLTAAELAVIVVMIGALGFAFGSLRGGLLAGLALAAGLGALPLLYLRRRENRRRQAFTAQLPDVLTLLVGALRAGYGLSQALELLVQELEPPASIEFGRVMRAVELGQPVQRALSDMARRVGSDDLDLVVTAITVQYEMGGNLAQTLDTIGETVRERIRLLRQVRVLTAQQRFTGYLLAAWPLFLAVALYLLNPEYISRLWAPGWIRLLPMGAILLQIVGFFAIRRIVDIEV